MGVHPSAAQGTGMSHCLKTSAQGKTRACFLLELVQGHSLLEALDINHPIMCETSTRPSAYSGVSPQGRSQGGHTFREHTSALGTHCSPAAQQGCPPGISVPAPGESHCHLEVPGWHHLVQGCVHEYPAPPRPPKCQPALCHSVP